MKALGAGGVSMLEHMTLLDALERFGNDQRRPEPPERPQAGCVTTVHAVDGVIIASPDALLSLRPASAFAAVHGVASAEAGPLERYEGIKPDPTW